MLKKILNLLILSVLILVVDSFFLKSISSYYNTLVNNIQGSDLKLKMLPTALCYLFIIFSLQYFIINKHVNIKQSVIDAALLGWSIYGIFEFTNHAIFEKWEWFSVIVDTTWGGILYGLVTYIYFMTNLDN